METLERRAAKPTSIGMKSSTKSCTKVDFFVNITDIIAHKSIDDPVTSLLESIIAPTVFNMFSCDGICSNSDIPFGRKSNRDLLISKILHHRAGPQRNIGYPRCTPTKLGPMSVLMLNKIGNVVLKRIDDLIVKECGCRGENNVRCINA